MRNRFQRTAAIIAATTLLGATVAGCSSESATDTVGSAANTDPGIIATTKVWADVASAVTGQEVDSIIQDESIDPHHFEPSAKDLARIAQAATVVANGGAYDAALYTVAEQDKIVHAIPLMDENEAHNHDHAEHDHGDHTHTHEDLDGIEHAWFAPAKVREVADAVAGKTGGDAGSVDKRMLDIEEKLTSIPHVHVGMTEPIAAGLVPGTQLHDITPEEYLHAAANHQEPSVSAVAGFIEQIEHGDLDLLIVNPQSTNGATQRLVDAAKAHNVPIVEIRETPPSGQNFLDYFEQVVDEIVSIANNAEPMTDQELEGHHH